MYYSNLNIHIVSQESFLESAVKKAAVPQRFTITVRTFSKLTPESLKQYDLLILDGITGIQEDEIKKGLKEDAKVILYGNGEELANLQKKLGQQYEDLWIKPCQWDFITVRLEHLLNKIKLEKDLWITQNYLDTAMDSIPDLIWFKDIRGAHLKVNQAFCEAVGKTKEDIQGRGHYYIWDLEPEEYAKGEYVCLETEEEVLRRKETCLFDERVKSKNGLRQFKTYKSPIFGQDGQVLGTVGIAHDVTDLQNMGTELEIVLQSMPFAILVKNSDGIILNINRKFSEYFGVSAEEMAGLDYDSWLEKLNYKFTDRQTDGCMEIAIQTDGQEHILEFHKEPIYDIFSDLVGEICICREVTVERALEQQILHNSHTDFLTGLYNRRYFYEYMAENRKDRKISMIYMDMDGFKQVNDTWGHKAGDEALILAARTMEACFPDAFVTRLGGDEFLITILGCCELAILQERAQGLLYKMEEAFSECGALEQLSASIGIAQSRDPQADIDTVLRWSDMALYRAKEQGGGRCCVYCSALDY